LPRRMQGSHDGVLSFKKSREVSIQGWALG